MSLRQVFPPQQRWYPLRLASRVATLLIAASVVVRVYRDDDRRSRLSACQANMHRLGRAMLLYAQDYDQTLTGMWTGPAGDGQAGGWMTYRAWPNPAPGDLRPQGGVLAPYVPSLAAFTCPGERSRRGCSYGMNGLLTVDGARRSGFHPGRKLAEIESPDRTLMLVEACSPPFPGPADGSAQPNGAIPWSRHPSGYVTGGAAMVNAAWCDGHAYARSEAEVRGSGLGGWHWNPLDAR